MTIRPRTLIAVLCFAWVLVMASVCFGDDWAPYTVTAYAHGCTMPRGAEGSPKLTASGSVAEPNWTVAAGPDLPFGTVLMLSADGIVTSRIVHDRGRLIQGRRLDLFMASCEQARRFGRRTVWVKELRRPLGAAQ